MRIGNIYIKPLRWVKMCDGFLGYYLELEPNSLICISLLPTFEGGI